MSFDVARLEVKVQINAKDKDGILLTKPREVCMVCSVNYEPKSLEGQQEEIEEATLLVGYEEYGKMKDEINDCVLEIVRELHDQNK